MKWFGYSDNINCYYFILICLYRKKIFIIFLFVWIYMKKVLFFLYRDLFCVWVWFLIYGFIIIIMGKLD